MKKGWIIGILLVLGLYGGYRWATEKPSELTEGEQIETVSEDSNNSENEENPIDLAERADQALENQAPPPPEVEAGIPNSALVQLKECFDMNVIGHPQEGSVTVEEVLEGLQRDLGPPLKQGDLWTDWVVRMKDGSDRKVHLENIEDLEGRVRQSVMIFMLDPRGQPFPIPLEGQDRDRPATDIVSDILSQGETYKKEQASFFQFARGERLEVIDVDGQPMEIEMVRDETLFRCDQLGPKPSCQCIK